MIAPVVMEATRDRHLERTRAGRSCAHAPSLPTLLDSGRDDARRDGGAGRRGDGRGPAELHGPQGDHGRQPARQPHQGHPSPGRDRRPGRQGRDHQQRRPRRHLRRWRQRSNHRRQPSEPAEARRSEQADRRPRQRLHPGRLRQRFHRRGQRQGLGQCHRPRRQGRARRRLRSRLHRGRQLLQVQRQGREARSPPRPEAERHADRGQRRVGQWHGERRGQRPLRVHVGQGLRGRGQLFTPREGRGRRKGHHQRRAAARFRRRRQLHEDRAGSWRRPRPDTWAPGAGHRVRRQLRRATGGPAGASTTFSPAQGASTTCSAGLAGTRATGATVTTTRRDNASSCWRSPRPVGAPRAVDARTRIAP